MTNFCSNFRPYFSYRHILNFHAKNTQLKRKKNKWRIWILAPKINWIFLNLFIFLLFIFFSLFFHSFQAWEWSWCILPPLPQWSLWQHWHGQWKWSELENASKALEPTVDEPKNTSFLCSKHERSGWRIG